MARFCTPLHCPNSHVTLQFFNITPLLSTLNCHVLTLCLASCPLLGWSTPTGFQHSAFTFGQESSIVRSSVAQGVFTHPTPQLPSCLPTVVSGPLKSTFADSPHHHSQPLSCPHCCFSSTTSPIRESCSCMCGSCSRPLRGLPRRSAVKIPAGALVAHLHRALIFVQAEVNLTAVSPSLSWTSATLDLLHCIHSLDFHTFQEKARACAICEHHRCVTRWDSSDFRAKRPQRPFALLPSIYNIFA